MQLHPAYRNQNEEQAKDCNLCRIYMLMPHPARLQTENCKNFHNLHLISVPVGLGVPVRSLKLAFHPILKSLSQWSLLLEREQADFCHCVSQTHPEVQFQGTHSHTILTHSLLLISSPEPLAQQWLAARKGKAVTPEWWGPSQCNYQSSTTSTCLFLPCD